MTGNPNPVIDAKQLQEFKDELSQFAVSAESTLKHVETNLEANKGRLREFSEWMLTIRGTSGQLGLPHIASIAELGEEIAERGAVAIERRQIRKSVGALWDALTTVKFLIENYSDNESDEEKILVNRLQATLLALGGAREKVGNDEVSSLIKAYRT